MKKVVILHSETSQKTFVMVVEFDKEKDDLLGRFDQERRKTFQMAEVPLSPKAIRALDDAIYMFSPFLREAVNAIARTVLEEFKKP